MWDFVGVLNQFRIYNDIFSPVLIVIATIFDWIAHNNPFVVSVSEVEHEGAQLSHIVDMKRAGFVLYCKQRCKCFSISIVAFSFTSCVSSKFVALCLYS